MKLGTDKERRAELFSSTQHACNILNTIIFPILKELRFEIDITDTETLNRYLRSIASLRSDYVEKMREGANNPALASVLEKSAEELWNKARLKYPVSNPGIIGEITADVFDFLTITGNDIYSCHIRANNPAIEKACTIEATDADIAKRKELIEVCEVLNRVFHGRGDLMWGYIGVDRGQFVLRDNILNFNPLIYGA